MTTITKTIDGITYTATVSEGRVTIQADGMGATEGDWDADAGRIDNAPGALCADPDDTEAVYSALETALVQAGA